MKLENVYRQPEVQAISAALKEAVAAETAAKAARDVAQDDLNRADRALQTARVEALVDKDPAMVRPFEKRLIDAQLGLKEAADELEVASRAATELALRKEAALEAARQRIAPGAAARMAGILDEVRVGLRPLLDLAGEFLDLEKVLIESRASACPTWPGWGASSSAYNELEIWRNLLRLSYLERGETIAQKLTEVTREQAAARGKGGKR